MNEITSLSLVLLAGVIFGIFFFGGLWWTIQKGVISKVPALWFLVSGVLRTIVVLTGFYYIGNGSWKKMLTCILGFFIVRMISTRFLRLPEGQYES